MLENSEVFLNQILFFVVSFPVPSYFQFIRFLVFDLVISLSLLLVCFVTGRILQISKKNDIKFQLDNQRISILSLPLLLHLNTTNERTAKYVVGRTSEMEEDPLPTHGTLAGFAPRKSSYLRISPTLVLQLILYLEPHHVEWMNVRLSSSYPPHLSLSRADEKEEGGIGGGIRKNVGSFKRKDSDQIGTGSNQSQRQ